MTDVSSLPSDLPVPTPSKAAFHLPGHPLPPLIELPSTSGGFVDLFLLSLTRPILLFIYPRTASPGETIKDSWNQIPGARGCTPELCSIRDELQPLLKKEPDLAIFGLSTQTSNYQQEVHKRLNLSFPLLSDSQFKLQSALDLPTFEFESTKYLQRITLLLREGQITQVQFPVFPSNKAAEKALEMLGGTTTNTTTTTSPPIDATTTPHVDEMKINEAYTGVLSDESNFNDIAATNSTAARVRAQEIPVPPPKDWSSNMRSLGRRQRTDRPSDWRNSLVAIDNETGEVVGVLAQGVVLSSTSEVETHSTSDDDDDEDDSDEVRTPNEQPLSYTAAHVYYDPDVRPSSRPASVLGEETFAPPPVPEKPDHLRIKGRLSKDPIVRSSVASGHSDSEAEDQSSDEIVDGRFKVHVAHLEAHRPDLLRDNVVDGRGIRDDEAYSSDASGSTVGGPAVQLWKKARGGKQAETKRKAKKAAKRVKKEEEERRRKEASIVPSIREPSQQSVHTESAETALEGEEEEVKPQHPTGLDNVSIAGDEEGAIELKSKGQAATRWQYGGTKKSVMSGHLQGNSVLIEFLAGSRIGASVIKSASSYIPKERSVASLMGPDAFTPTSIAKIPQTGALAYIPVLPSHLLWFFGLGGEQREGESSTVIDGEGAVPGPVAVMGEDLSAMMKLMSPSALLQMATQGASTAWNSVFHLGASATSWLGSSLSALAFNGIGEVEPNLDEAEQGDEDAQEWEWATPSYDANSLGGTPRPIYRRKKLIPSLEGNFNNHSHDDHQDTARFSIVHFDHLGIARRAYTQFQSFKGLGF